ncbi:hypothetical protein CTA1_10633 [Colletotrichum tanaceti]|uniref:Uncharacterized protein n=1 Tax=Colletotrichum tanaceti TaxID=1306861 RepID=A0A4V6DHS2_9PEZI|nr:hypothetical protein CTA1_10633 [Colletotrichum tanaceti]
MSQAMCMTNCALSIDFKLSVDERQDMDISETSGDERLTYKMDTSGFNELRLETRRSTRTTEQLGREMVGENSNID